MKTQLINFTIPNELLEKIDSLAKKRLQSRAEVLREAAWRLIDETREREDDFATIGSSAKRIGLSENEAAAVIDKVRAKLSINT